MVNEAHLIRRYRLAAGVAAAVFIGLAGSVVVFHGGQDRWQEYQEVYRDTLAARASSELQRQSSREYPVEVRQISIPAIQRKDRCVSCHVGIEDARMSGLPLPYRSHGGDLLTTHPPERFGCTVCHGGIGQALDRGESCGSDRPDELHVPFVPLHSIESSCGRCHLAIFDTASTGMPVLQRGKLVLRHNGCLGCHRIRGKGGSVGPDLSNEGSKDLRSFDFSHVPGPRTVSGWMSRHFADPAGVSPGSTMPAFALPDADLEALVVAVRGLYSSTLPPEYLTLPVVKELKGATPPIGGPEGFALFCVACHGAEGRGKDFAAPPFGVPTLASEDFQSVASDEYLLFTIVEGRGERMMASWSPRASHLQGGELREIAAALRRWRAPFRDPVDIRRAGPSRIEGAEIFSRNCVPCHGPQGEGDIAKGITNADFLALASDRFLLETILRGRSNTAMPSWSRLSDRELGSVLAFLRGKQTTPGRPGPAMGGGGNSVGGDAPGAHTDSGNLTRGTSTRGHAARGDSLFYNLCSRCHGRYGEGDLGPAVLNRDFLAAATDVFLFETISRGRAHTPMFGWTRQPRAGQKLVAADVDDLVAFMRTAPRPDFLPPGPGGGNPASGARYFRELCAECHGETGEGKKAPALRNQEFLGAATNGYLIATITLGRRGTPMPSWGTGSLRYRRLSSGERNDLVAFLRSWQTIVIRSEALR